MESLADCVLSLNPSSISLKLFRGHLGQLEKVKGEEPDLEKELPARLKARLSCPGQTKVSCSSIISPIPGNTPKVFKLLKMIAVLVLFLRADVLVLVVNLQKKALI